MTGGFEILQVEVGVLEEHRNWAGAGEYEGRG
jgi:hypothetical protein